MLSATYSEFRKDLKQFLDQVITNVDTLIIHRGKGKAVCHEGPSKRGHGQAAKGA